MQHRTEIFKERSMSGIRLAELDLTAASLLAVRDVAVAAAADATPFHPANAAGTFSYQHGTYALRRELTGNGDWRLCRPNGVEAIENPARRVRIVFANVDVACDDEHEPRARSDKGAGAERLCAGNGLFEDLPRYFSRPDQAGDWLTYYLMVAADGAVELSRATISGNRFGEFHERIYLSDDSDLIEPDLLDGDDDLEQFDPLVRRK